MFGFTYKFTVNPVKQTITLRPTLKTYAQAFAPMVVFGVIAAVVVAAAEAMDNVTPEPQSTPEND